MKEDSYLEIEKVVDFTLTTDSKTLVVREQCDYFYQVIMNKGEAKKMLRDLTKLINRMQD